MKRHLFRNGPEKTVIIGVAGTRAGCGTTHFALCAANYLSNVLKRRVMASSHCTDALRINNNLLKNTRQAEVIQDDVGDGAMFVHANITFLAAEDRAEHPMRGKYDYHIVDFGQVDSVGEYELYSCDRLFLIGDLSLWNYEASIKSAYLLERRYAGKICFMSVFYSKEGIKAYRRAVKEQPVIIPVDMEPFAISRETLLFMEKLFKEEAYGISSMIKK